MHTNCPECGSNNVRPHGTNQIHCKACGKYPVVLKGGQRWASKKDNVPQGVTFDRGGNVSTRDGGRIQEITATVPYHMTDEELLDYLGVDREKYCIIKAKYSRVPIYRKDRKGEWSYSNGSMEGWSEDSGNMLVSHMYGVQVWVERKSAEIKTKSAGEEILKRIEKASPKVPRRKYKKSKDDLLLQVMIPDIHFGRVTRSGESDENYNMRIAYSVVSLALDNILQKASNYKVGKILLPFGNDAFNVDNERNTTANGTIQQEESWWAESFTQGEALFSYIMDRLLEVAPVDVMFVPGNHDPHRLWYFGRVAEAVYKNNKNVSVTNSPKSRQYYNYVGNTFMLTHGNNPQGGLVKLDKLPNTMAFELRRDYPEWFLRSKVLEIHMGHLHHKQELEYTSLDNSGVTLRFFRSLTTSDKWHFDSQFVGSPKAAEGLLWTPNDGLFAQLPATISMEHYQ